MKDPRIRRKTNIIPPSNIPPDVALRASKAKRSPVGPCDCGRRGYLQNAHEYICPTCMNIASNVHDEALTYSTCGSNRHRVSNKPITPHYVDAYATQTTKNNILM